MRLSTTYTFEFLKSDYKLRSPEYRFSSLKISDERLLHWVGSINRSGFQREKSLLWLIENFTPGDEDRILLRLEDWVPEVSRHAEKWVIDNLYRFSFSNLQNYQNVVVHLIRKDRLKESIALARLNNTLLENLWDLDGSHFYSSSAPFRTHLYRIGIESDSNLRQWILKDPSPFIRSLMLELVPYNELTSAENKSLMADPSYQVKKRYIVSTIKAGQNLEKKFLMNLIYSNSKSMRELTRYYLKRDYQIDLYKHYLSLNSDLKYFAADFCRKEDVQLFLDGYKCKRRAIRYSCINALCTVSPQELRNIDFKTLMADSKKIRLRVYRSMHTTYNFDEICSFKEQIIQSLPNGLVRYLNLINKWSFWEFLSEITSTSVLSTDIALQQLLRSKIKSHTSVSQPATAEQRERILNGLNRIDVKEGQHLQQLISEIRFIVNSVR